MRLVAPTSRLHLSWLEARGEWSTEESMDGSSIHSAARMGLELSSLTDFTRWVEDLLLQADPSRELPPDRVPATNLWVVDDERYVGCLQLRHHLTPLLSRLGGHIGYSVRPSARRRGVATFALRGSLPRARRLGLERVLVTCDDDNIGSMRTIEACGGVCVDISPVTDEGRAVGVIKPTRRYWIPVTAPAGTPEP